VKLVRWIPPIADFCLNVDGACKGNPGETGVSVPEEDIVRSDSEHEELCLPVVGVVLRLEMTSRGVRRGVSSRPQHLRVLLYFLHHCLWTMAQAPAPVPQEQGHGGPSIMERFKRMAPPSFKGESQPLLAESWMREVEKIFRAIRCAENDKVSLATYMLHVGEQDGPIPGGEEGIAEEIHATFLAIGQEEGRVLVTAVSSGI
ncbi:hypothetical protein Taro_041541, partial [Colocasia esculenta]|nr:hypothetical protein [Colocasia esculenta]